MYPSLTMDDDTLRKRITALRHLMQARTLLRKDSIPCEIEEGLYLGSIGAANNKNALKSLNITHILTISSTLSPAFPDDFIYKAIRIEDTADVNISEHFDECLSFIDEAKRMGGAVLVHCFAGRSRSVTVIVAYLMTKHGMSLAEALEHVKQKRPAASPNYGFMSQLQNLERTLQGKLVGNNLWVWQNVDASSYYLVRPMYMIQFKMRG